MEKNQLWFFIWRKSNGDRWVTTICGHRRADVYKEVRAGTFPDNRTWREAISRGARIEKLTIVL